MQADLYQYCFSPRSGWVTLTNDPVLGADPDLDVIQRYRIE
jgi:hypothetical protein